MTNKPKSFTSFQEEVLLFSKQRGCDTLKHSQRLWYMGEKLGEIDKCARILDGSREMHTIEDPKELLALDLYHMIWNAFELANIQGISLEPYMESGGDLTKALQLYNERVASNKDSKV